MAGEEGTQGTQRTAADIEAELAGLDFQPVGDEGTGGEVDAAVALEAELAEAESQATRQGWVPRDKYKGDAKKWVDAKTFVERGERFTSNLQQEISALRTEVESFKGTKAAFIKFHEETVARKDTELKEAIANLRVQRSAAQQDGEHETVVQIEDRIDLLKEQQKELKAPIETPVAAAAKPGLDMNNPVLTEWIDEDNQWFRDEPKLRDYAIAVGEGLIENGETVRGRPFLDKVAEIMRRDFPRRFKPQSSTIGEMGSAVGSSSRSSGAGGNAAGKTERDLPPEDQALMRQFIKEGWTTKDKFLASYFA